jgi:prefoldin subunit 5
MTLDREVESLKVEVRYLKEGQDQLRSEIKGLREDMQNVNNFVTEARYGKQYLIGIMAAAVVAAQLIDYLCRLIKIY